jgi:hypothetical protein
MSHSIKHPACTASRGHADAAAFGIMAFWRGLAFGALASLPPKIQAGSLRYIAPSPRRP